MTEQRDPAERPDPDIQTRNQENRDDASKTEGGAASGALIGTAVGGPLGTVVGAAVGSLAGGAAEAADETGEDARDSGDGDRLERTGEPGDSRGFDLRDPRMGGHVGGSDPDDG